YSPCRKNTRLIEDPAAEDLVATFPRGLTTPSLVAILFPGLDIERLAEELARLDVDQVDALLEDQEVAEHLRHGPVAVVVSGFELHGWHAPLHAVAAEAGHLVHALRAVEFRGNVVIEVAEAGKKSG
ncbi:MAG: hypothetical protein ACK56I_04530, partial [bacterium]